MRYFFYIKKDTIKLSFIIWMVLSLLILSWPFEEPSKIQSAIVFSGIYLSGLLFILWYKNQRLIENENLWIVLFSVKISLSYLLLTFFWVMPLESNGFLRTSVQDALVTDANYYDYAALEIAKSGLSNNIDLFFSTWLSFGVITYLYLIYATLGQSILYVILVNSVLILWAVLLLGATVAKVYPEKSHNAIHNRLAFIMLLPYGAYYDASPSKEPLTILAICLFIYYLADLINQPKVKLWSSFGWKLLLGFIFTMLIRPNLAILILIPTFILLWNKIKRINLLFSIVLILVLLYGFIELSVGFSAFYNAFTDYEKLSAIRNSSIELVTNNEGVKGVIATNLAPDNLSKLVFLAPIRFLIWFLLPFPFIMPNWIDVLNMPILLHSDWNTFFRLPETVLRMMSTWIIILFIPVFIKIIAKTYNKSEYKFLLKIFLVFFIVLTLALSSYNFINGGRYRVVLEPLYFTICVIGSDSKKILHSRYLAFYFFVILIVLASYFGASI
jgi:hypothetical protein